MYIEQSTSDCPVTVTVLYCTCSSTSTVFKADSHIQCCVIWEHLHFSLHLGRKNLIDYHYYIPYST